MPLHDQGRPGDPDDRGGGGGRGVVRAPSAQEPPQPPFCPSAGLTPGPGAGAPIEVHFTWGPLTQRDVDLMNDLPGVLTGLAVGAALNLTPLRKWASWGVGGAVAVAQILMPREGYRPQVGDFVTYWYAARGDAFYDSGIDPRSERRCITVARP